MPTDRAGLGAAAAEFVTERHVASLVTLRGDGTPHSVAIAFTYDPDAGSVRVITDGGSVKARNVRRRGYAAVTQVDGARWITLEGTARVLDDPETVRDAERRHAVRYRTPRENPTRVVIELTVTRVLQSRALRAS
ncbi:TIGR03618 family F420-dependent PPOX class oxidoreductase [Tsukamurella sp. 8F]|uniref:pyridoxamine 5'-phosphate oxidase family protein n=1 Tax=unclassified Tsukamurella TaxID=2633480 RepID=UPI0023B9943D|nr:MULTISPECIES: TIGR03618 family F420-dependent PPOX class oxidoreductase [unclassified Tsukamurella]MDF0530560.1 TIGR03618 family F420-dependent PPOX class oxidoreductase [Tsukamurella sp. 8J]MDF0586790.1 TIGR03618 family F420-dependent PPOX class oxidoreductase [Tsukamurella sp. 8F]